MTLDNDLLDLWLLAGLVGGLDEATSKRLIDELQEMRTCVAEASADVAKAMVPALERHDAVREDLEGLRDQLTTLIGTINEIGDDLHRVKEEAT